MCMYVAHYFYCIAFNGWRDYSIPYSIHIARYKYACRELAT